ncbi:MAG: ABC transporter substrate-binding protein [Rhodoblastus sp.]
MVFRILRIAATIAPLFLAAAANAETTTLRVGHFPNVTHVQGLIGHHLSRIGKGWFEQRLGPDVKIEWFVYNAGPSAMEAIFARSVDLTYVGPSPAINAYSRAGGKEIKIVAGAADGGAALVVQPELSVSSAADLKGKKMATPQLGNTQDISARAWASAGGLRVTLSGGDLQILPTANPDQLALFKTKQLDAVWTVEPWVSRLEKEADGKVAVEETKAVTTVLASSDRALAERPQLVAKFVQAHRELTEWIKSHEAEAQDMVRQELAEETRGQISADIIARAWKRITLTDKVDLGELKTFVGNAEKAGLLKNPPDLNNLVASP